MGGFLVLRFAQMFPGTVKKVMSCDAPGLSSLQAAKPLWEERMTLFRNEGVRGLPGSLFNDGALILAGKMFELDYLSKLVLVPTMDIGLVQKAS